jgi:hypothetical protein
MYCSFCSKTTATRKGEGTEDTKFFGDHFAAHITWLLLSKAH